MILNAGEKRSPNRVVYDVVAYTVNSVEIYDGQPELALHHVGERIAIK